jgi:preprotein translocase subunit SecD
MTLPIHIKIPSSRYLSISHINLAFPNQTLTSLHSKKAKAELSMTLNSYLYSKPDVVERLTQGQSTTADGYRDQAAGHIMDFEKAFAVDGSGKTKC